MNIGPNFVYLHIPKTAGSSFEEMLEKKHNIRRQVRLHQHAAAIDIPECHRDKFIFGFVRHPVLAEYSNYRYHKFSWGGTEDFNFSSWCYWRFGQYDKNYAKRFRLAQRQIDHGWNFNIHPQAGYFTDETGKCIADKIYRFEDLQSSLADIQEKIGLDCNLKGRQNMAYNWGTIGTKKENYWDDIKEEDVELIRQAKRFDFDWILSEGEVSIDYTHYSFKDYASSHD